MPVVPLFIKMAVPAVLSQLINILYNLVDKMFIGHLKIEGAKALAGLGVTTPVILFLSAFAALVSMGGAPKAAIALGRNEKDKAERIMGSCMALLLIISFLLTVGMLIWGKDILLIFGASKDTIRYAVDYMRIYCLGTVFIQLSLGLNTFITTQGFAKVSMINVTIGTVINIMLDPIMIYVCNLVMLLLPGLVQGAQPILSYNLGAGRKERVIKTFHYLLLSCVAGSCIVWAACMVFPESIIGIFTNSTALRAYSVTPLRTYLSLLCIYGI